MNLQAGGPLFIIESPQGSVNQLQLPHCQPEPPSDSLSVLHISDDGTSLLQPVTITETHVVVNVPHLSVFGIVSNLIQNFKTRIRGQALLFRDSINKFLSIYLILLPCNVPLYEVKKFHSGLKFITVPSQCTFYRDQTHSCHSDPGGFEIQPSEAEISANYGPNYHPLFTMHLPLSTEEVTVIIKYQDQAIWKYKLHLPGIEEQERQQSFFSAQNLREIRPKFIENVSDPTLKKLLLKLRQCEVITSNEEEKVRAPELKSERARILFDTVKNKGEKASSILMKSLQEEDEFCFDNLMLGIDQ
ncbi:uncharacterized protein LOC112141605 [Oryzias melastigma]|nr:uncharacterized protein LOC112141605 [Oryzias melastigma]